MTPGEQEIAIVNREGLTRGNTSNSELKEISKKSLKEPLSKDFTHLCPTSCTPQDS